MFNVGIDIKNCDSIIAKNYTKWDQNKKHDLKRIIGPEQSDRTDCRFAPVDQPKSIQAGSKCLLPFKDE